MNLFLLMLWRMGKNEPDEDVLISKILTVLHPPKIIRGRHIFDHEEDKLCMDYL